jgi:hypothetical protein
MRFPGITLPANGVRPEPSGLPLAGSKMTCCEPLALVAPLKSPFRSAALGTLKKVNRLCSLLYPSYEPK